MKYPEDVVYILHLLFDMESKKIWLKYKHTHHLRECLNLHLHSEYVISVPSEAYATKTIDKDNAEYFREPKKGFRSHCIAASALDGLDFRLQMTV